MNNSQNVRVYYKDIIDDQRNFKQSFLKESPVPVQDIRAIRVPIQNGNSHDEVYRDKFYVFDEKFVFPKHILEENMYQQSPYILEFYNPSIEERIKYLTYASQTLEDKQTGIYVVLYY